MTKKAIFTLMAVAFVLGFPGFGQDTQGTLSMSLEECIIKALKDNLGVAIQVLGPQISAEGVNAAQEKYIPTLSMSARSQKQESNSYSFLDAQAESSINRTQNYTFLSASQTLPTGGALSLEFTGYRTASNQTGVTINPRFGTTLRFSLNQPLLKNFGLKINQREILVAKNNLGISEENLKNTLMTTIYNVESAYWNLVYSIESLEVRRQSLALAKDLLEKNQRSVEVGTLAPMEVLSARAEVATREADLILAETQIQSYGDQLRLLLNMTEDEGPYAAALVPKDKPVYVARKVDLNEALAAAIANRPDLEISRIGLESNKLSLSLAKNQALPDLSLSASYYSPGIDGTRIVYVGSPLDGIVDYTIPGGMSGAMKQTTSFKYPNWNLGLTLSIPLSNIFSRANLAQARLNMQQAMLELEQQRGQVYLEIKNAVRSVESNYKRILAYTTARELAEQKLAAEEEKRRVGMSTNYMVLTYQRDLANARISELNSIISYNVSLAALEKAMGTSLKSKNIRLSDYAPARD
jgi:outer membrane protein TolC